MMISKAIVLTGVLAAALAPAAVHAHATYNISGYGSGLAGSTNGADGLPADGTSAWTNGPVADYTGALPVNWYCGLHSATQVRTLQTGLPTPPSGSLLQQVNSYNAANDPDLPTDRVLAVGGLSWTDPANGDQGWGHGLDYGLIHVSPVGTILAGGPAKLTITLMDDPSDSPSVRLAYALYAGWDTSTTASRHQTFITSPSPVNDPLGSTGLTLIDFAVASSAGGVLSRSYDIDAAHAGEYTILVGALGGVAGQYQLTAGVFPDNALGQCQDDLATVLADADDDGVLDGSDACADTPAATAVDAVGCSLAQFCGGLEVSTKTGQKACKKADWGNDEPLIGKKTADCLYDKKNTQTCIPTDIP
jgi:hypothetical protein